ncbi:MAG TPA: SurA N-terminal domain-containing protein [Bacteroidales bacterium]|nr:SurA N-terminal domain-containing protein [Bacteroidales bacterium]
MSTLQFLREKAGILVAGVIGLSLLLFVVSDFFGNGRGQRVNARKYYEIGEIGGEIISYQDYDLRLQNLLEIYKLSGNNNIDEATTETLREQTWQQMVREKILDSHYKKLGIGVSTEEVDELVLGNNPHQIVQQLFTDQNTGIFNKSFLVNFLKQTEFDESAKKYWLFFENEIVNDRMNTKYNNLVSKGLYVTSKQAEFDKNIAMNTVDFSYILKNYASLPDSSVTISESDIHTYYSKHKATFKRNALRDIEYVTFDVEPSEDDVEETKQWISKTKEEFATSTDPVQFINLSADSRYVGFFSPLSMIPENLKDFVKKEDLTDVFGPYTQDGSFKVAKLLNVANRPDSVHARHILLSTNQTRSLADAKRQADSLIKLIKSGTPFDDLALANSDDQGSAQIGGDLGWFPEGRMVVPFNNACFSGKKGDIKIAETTFGIHIIEILAQSKDTKKYNIGIIDRKILPGSVTNQKIYSEASQFAGTNNTYEKFTKAITTQGLDKRVANDIAPQQQTLPGLDKPRSLIISLFQAEAGKIILDNNQQAVFEIGDKYVVAFCSKAQEDGVAPVTDVENDIRFVLIKDKKADIISSEFIKNTGSGKTIDDIARTMGLTVQEATQINFRSYTVPGVGTEPALIGAATVSQQGNVAGPVKGSNGVYMLTVNTLTTPDGEDLKLLQNRLKVTFQMRGNYEAYEALRKSADIKDRRYKFY